MADDAFTRAELERARKFGAPEGDDGIVRCDACPVLCRIRPGRAGACDRYANAGGTLVRTDPVVFMQRAAERWKPEAMYFTDFDGMRTAFLVFDMPDSSAIPPFAEPFFMELNADVQLAPAMNGADLEKGLSQVG